MIFDSTMVISNSSSTYSSSSRNNNEFPYKPLSAYNISVERGLLPLLSPLLSLPPAYAVWDDVGAQLPKLLIAGVQM